MLRILFSYIYAAINLLVMKGNFVGVYCWGVFFITYKLCVCVCHSLAYKLNYIHNSNIPTFIGMHTKSKGVTIRILGGGGSGVYWK